MLLSSEFIYNTCELPTSMSYYMYAHIHAICTSGVCDDARHLGLGNVTGKYIKSFITICYIYFFLKWLFLSLPKGEDNEPHNSFHEYKLESWASTDPSTYQR